MTTTPELIREQRDAAMVDRYSNGETLDAIGQSVVVTVHEHGKGRESGVPVERPHFQVWTFRRGKLVRWEAFASEAAALEAAGLQK